MDDRMKNVLLSLSSEWRVFAHSTGLNAHIIGYIDLHDLSDQLKMEFFLRELVTWHPSCFMTLIENSLSVMEKVDVLEELKSFQIDDRLKNIIVNLSSEWRVFAKSTGLNDDIVGYIDLHDLSDQLKMEFFLRELVKWHPSCFMTLIKNSLNKMGREDILNELKLYDASDLLKTFYAKSYGDEQQFEQNPVNTDFDVVKKCIELTLTDAANTFDENCNEWEYFIEKLNVYRSASFSEVFSKQPQVLLFSGIGGIGKTWFLQKCLFFWAQGLLWKKIDFVFFFEFKILNQFCSISSTKELINKFYKNILKGLDIMSSQMTVMFVIDGLDEFIHLDQLYKHISRDSNNLPIITTLMHILNAKNNKCVVGGRVEAITRYWNLVRKHKDISHIQIMGFSNFGTRNYFRNCLLNETLETDLLKLYTSAPVAKALLSVPFYVKAVCSTSSHISICSLKTITELLTLIFLHFVQKSSKTAEINLSVQMNKEHILKVCKVAYNLLNEKKVMVYQAELNTILDDNGFEPFGLIVKSNVSHQYQFVHLFLMRFCASIHLYLYENPQKAFKHEKLHTCLPVTCGLFYGNEQSFLSLITQLQVPIHKEKSWLREICDLTPEGISVYEDQKMFIECFFEAQASITDDLKESLKKREWMIVIRDRKTAHEVLNERFFIEKLINAGIKLRCLSVYKNILSEDEENLLTKCSTNVRHVYFYRPLKLDDWSPKHTIEYVKIDISETFVSKNEFEGFLPWIRLAEQLELFLHKDTNFIDVLCEWLRGSSFNWLEIRFFGTYFHNIEELKNFYLEK